MKNRVGDFLETFSGTAFYTFDPKLTEVELGDIAHALSLLCRFNGHARYFYSVAQHSLNVKALLEHEGRTSSEQLKGLLHDASEAYLCDVPRPIKPFLNGYYEAEDRVQKTIERKFGIAELQCKDVKKYDDQMLGYEANHLMPCKAWSPKDYGPEFEDAGVIGKIDISERSPQEVEKEFMWTAYSLLYEISTENKWRQRQCSNCGDISSWEDDEDFKCRNCGKDIFQIIHVDKITDSEAEQIVHNLQA